jgi:type II restriction/modification system DNA methylase subunit YeeA
LTAGDGGVSLDLTKAKPLQENAGVSFEGTKKYGDFDIPGEQARHWLKLPNPHNRPNCEVVKPWANGMDITRRSSDTWIIDFGTTMSEADASLYEIPFHYLHEHVKPEREKVRRERTRRKWWIHEEARVSMRAGLAGLSRFIVTPRVAKHRLFVWLNAGVLPDNRLNIIARSDDTIFGILHSRLHEIWSLGTDLGMALGMILPTMPNPVSKPSHSPQGFRPPTPRRKARQRDRRWATRTATV